MLLRSTPFASRSVLRGAPLSDNGVSRELSLKAKREMVLPTTLDSLRPGRHAALQLFKPVQHDVDLRRRRLRLLACLEHQEALAIGRHVVVAGRCRNWRVRSLKEHLRLANGETWLSGNVHSHHLVPAAVK